MDRLKQIDWLAWLATIALIIVFREGAVLIMGAFHHPELGNLVGLISLLLLNVPARMKVNYKLNWRN